MPRYQILPWLFRGIDQSVLRSDAPTIIRELPKFIRPAHGLILDLLLARVDMANGRYRASKVHVIKHDDGRGKQKKREREGGLLKQKHNLIVTRVAIVRR